MKKYESMVLIFVLTTLTFTALAIALIITTAATKQKIIEFKHKNIEAVRCLNKMPPLPKRRKKR